MNGADALISTLVANGVTACFANPGTSEMQFVAALDRKPEMRPVLCLFEGVATGAADGYGRIAGQPACTLLHLGPGYGNGIANLHNARRAFTPIVNVIGDHATYHRQFDAPLNSDIATLAAPNSIWLRSADRPDDVAALTADAVAASFGPPGGSASLILPADTAWLETDQQVVLKARPQRPAPSDQTLRAAADAIRAAKKPALLLGGQACSAEGLRQGGRLAAAGLDVFADTFIARLPRGAGHFAPRRMPYYSEEALQALDGVDLLLLAGTTSPVAFFAYPGRASELVPDGCRALTVSSRAEDSGLGLQILADAIGAPAQGPQQRYARADAAPQGPLSARSCGVAIARHLPEAAIVCDDSATSGGAVAASTATAAPHEVLALTGGGIGIGIPLALGAGVAAPDRKVVVLVGDGSAMYNVQGLWSLVREDVDVCVVVFANRSYRILNIEMERTGSGSAGPQAEKLLELVNPTLDWVQLAGGLGMPAVRCETGESFDRAFSAAMGSRGQMLIEAVI